MGRFHRLCWTTVFLMLAMALVIEAETPPRFALVIGNGSYVELGKLANPTNDASDMADALRSIGFQVDLLLDANVVDMQDAVVRLGNRLSISTEATGFFYYAGHGVQSNSASRRASLETPPSRPWNPTPVRPVCQSEPSWFELLQENIARFRKG